MSALKKALNDVVKPEREAYDGKSDGVAES
jgi:hypothetical protein